VTLGALYFQGLVNIVQGLLLHLIVLGHEGIVAAFLVLLGVEFAGGEQKAVANFAADSVYEIGN
jgi:hypothetical protein